MICKNCLKEYEGNYCNHCGQKTITRKLNFKDIFTEILDSFNLNRGLFLTFKLLIISPEVLLNNFINGKRKTYYNPIKFLLILATVKVLITTLIEKEGKEIEVINSPLWLLLYLIILIPILSFFSYLVSKKKYNFIENLVVNTYSFGVINFFLTINYLLKKILILSNSNNIIVGSLSIILIPTLYLAYIYMKLYKKNIIVMFFFSLLIYVISYSLFLLGLIMFDVVEIKDFSTN